MQGRLETWTQDDGYRNVSEVKAFINDETNKELFHPEWLLRKTLLHRELYDINPVHDQTVEASDEKKKRKAQQDLERLQSKMKKKVCECAFHPDGHSGEL